MCQPYRCAAFPHMNFSPRARSLDPRTGKTLMSARAADFATLGLAPGASVDAAKSAFKRLALVHHPDKGGSAAKFREISSAVSAIAEAAGRVDEVDALLADPLADILGANWARGFADGSVDPMQASGCCAEVLGQQALAWREWPHMRVTSHS